MADFFSSNQSAPDTFPRRGGLPYIDASGVNNLANNLYSYKQFRSVYFVQENRREYFTQPEPYINTSLLLLITPTLKYFAHQELSDLTYIRDRRSSVHYPEFIRTAAGSNLPFVPPPVGSQIDGQAILDGLHKDKMMGMDFMSQMYLSPPSFYSLYPEIPQPYPRKIWLIPEFGHNSELPLGSLPVYPPIFTNTSEPDFLFRARQPRFDDPPNVFTPYTALIAAPFFQLDWPTPPRSYNKYLTLWNYIDAEIPNPLIPPAPPVAPVGGAEIFGLFQQGKILGRWGGGNNDGS